MLIDFSMCTYVMSLMCDTAILPHNYKLEHLWFVETDSRERAFGAKVEIVS